ncbi:hypothetical protein PRUB_a3979 [Pseudoalteromonas rubra]|uniref:Methyltransferase n=1 Tax=Pseudoalteromonas rubra TaxID=43658 RepID=A0A8T0C8W9_9GAMM|nr:TylF/MycF/NovP-related O-methyltransferase [Pseudoalteromonas rubra]KAF7787113.1 hypothetical protein PRUB_a3979 [Pseudoalteromonas rubra]
MEVVIFGAGKGGSNTYQLLKTQSDINVVAFSDNNESIWYTEMFGVEIMAPEQLLGLDFDKIIIASQYRKQIRPQLESLGISPDKIEVAHQNLMDGTSVNDNIFHVYSDHKEPDYKPYVSLREETFRTLAKYTELVISIGIKGDIAEFGCGTGQSSYMLSKTMRDCNNYYETNSKLHLFDSFEGLPVSKSEVDLESPLVQAGVWGECACASISADKLSDTIRSQLDFNNFQTYEGWFNETLPTIAAGTQFSLVHLDCDLYESTMQVLEHLLANNMLSAGAVLMFDDWSCNNNSPLYGQQKAWTDICDKYQIVFNDREYYGFGSHVKVIHSYQPK